MRLVTLVSAALHRGRSRAASTDIAEADALAATLQRRILRRGRMLIDDEAQAPPPGEDGAPPAPGRERAP